MKDKASAASHSSFIIPHSSFAFMLPEISRRCMSCGAAVRAGARFCPQCGEAMAGAEARPSAATTESRSAQSSVEGPSDAREGGASHATTASGADDVVNAGDVVNVGDVVNAGKVLNAGDVANSDEYAS